MLFSAVESSSVDDALLCSQEASTDARGPGEGVAQVAIALSEEMLAREMQAKSWAQQVLERAETWGVHSAVAPAQLRRD